MTISKLIERRPLYCMMCSRTTPDAGGSTILMGKCRVNEEKELLEVDPESFIVTVCSECADVFERLLHRFVTPDVPHP